jgi:hypothetical protein
MSINGVLYQEQGDPAEVCAACVVAYQRKTGRAARVVAVPPDVAATLPAEVAGLRVVACGLPKWHVLIGENGT